MEDDLKPRRPQWEEKAEINDSTAKAVLDAEALFLRPRKESSLSELIQQREEDEEAAMQRREQDETPWERAESERILRAEAEIKADIPVRRQREFRRTFAQKRRRQAAMASL